MERYKLLRGIDSHLPAVERPSEVRKVGRCEDECLTGLHPWTKSPDGVTEDNCQRRLEELKSELIFLCLHRGIEVLIARGDKTSESVDAEADGCLWRVIRSIFVKIRLPLSELLVSK